MVAVCKEAALTAMAENLETEVVKIEHVDFAISKHKRRVTPDMLKVFESFVAQEE